MSIFTKSLSQLGSADLHELVSEGAIENMRLEFKSEVPGKDETIKKLSSFANTFGGYLVVGAKANSADGRIQELNGVDVQPGYKQKLIQWAFDACNPPLLLEVSDPIPAHSGNGRVCYVVYVPESDAAPHFLNGRKGVWVRTDEYSARFEAHLADESELRHLLDRRSLIRKRRAGLIERAKRRFDTYTKLINGGVFFSLFFIPRFPARQLCEQSELKSLTQPNEANWISWRQVLFPEPRSHVIYQHESAIIPSAARGISFFEINVWGSLFYSVRIDVDDAELHLINVTQLVGYVLLFIQHAGKMLRRLGYSGPLHIETTLGPLSDDTVWVRSTKHGADAPLSTGVMLDESVTFAIARTSDEFIEKCDRVAMDILYILLYAVDLPCLVDTQSMIEDLIRHGYNYNFWDEPTILRV